MKANCAAQSDTRHCFRLRVKGRDGRNAQMESMSGRPSMEEGGPTVPTKFSHYTWGLGGREVHGAR